MSEGGEGGEGSGKKIKKKKKKKKKETRLTPLREINVFQQPLRSSLTAKAIHAHLAAVVGS